MKIEFLKPRFTGARFDEHTLPVDVARDLAAYEELLIELAKHLWLTDHPGRARVPKGFEKGFSLHLEGMIGEGSAEPLLAWVASGALVLSGGRANYFEQARDLVAECVGASAASQPLPGRFPKNLLDYFNLFGRSLRDDEALDLPRPNNAPPAVLNPERRKALILAAQRVYTKDVELDGIVEETDYTKQTFRLRSSSGPAVIVALPDVFKELVRAAGGKDRTVATVKGVGVYDAWDRLQKIVETHHIELLPNAALADELEELMKLEDGWYEGQGKAPDKAHLEWATEALVKSFPEDLPFPLTAPTSEGGLFLEWIQTPWRISAEFLLPTHKCELQATNTSIGLSEEKALDLDQTGNWMALFEFVRKHV